MLPASGRPSSGPPRTWGRRAKPLYPGTKTLARRGVRRRARQPRAPKNAAMAYAFVDHERLPRTAPADRLKNVRWLSANDVRTRFGAPDDRLECRELLDGDDPEVRLYGDLDVRWPREIREEDVRSKTHEVRRELDRIRDTLADGAPAGASPVTYRLATRHGFNPSKGAWKMSFRPYFSGVRMRSSVARELWAKLGTLDWDLAPFGRNRLLGMVNCAKGWSGQDYDGRVLAPERPDDDPMLYVAQATDASWTEVSFDPLRAHARAHATAAAAQHGRGDPDLVRSVLAGVRKEEDYTRWTRVGWAVAFELGKTDRAREIFRAWSARAPNYDARACDRLIDAARTEGGCCCTMATLRRFLAEDGGPAAPAAQKVLDVKEAAAVMAVDVQRRILEAVSALYPEHFGGFADGAGGHVRAGGDFLTFAIGDKQGRIDREYGVHLEDGTWVGALLNRTRVEGSLAALHSSVPDDLRFILERVTGDTHKFKSDGAGDGGDDASHATITWCKTQGGLNDSARVVVPGRRSTTLGPKHHNMELIRSITRNTLDKHAALDARLQVVHNVFNSVSIGVQNNIIVHPATVDDDAGACESFIAWLNEKGYRPVQCEGRLIIYDPDDGIYHDRSNHRGLRLLLRKACIGEYSTSSSRQDALFKQLDDMVPDRPTFLADADLSAKRRIAFANGVWDFARRELLPFSPDIVLFHKLPHSFPVTEGDRERTQGLAEQIWSKVVHPIWTRSAEYVMQNTARAAAGHVEDRTYHFGIGDTASGKGVWMDIVASALTSNLVGIINSGNILWQRRGGDQAKSNSWICAIKDALINFTSEIQLGPGVAIDGNKLKELANGGERHMGRQNNQNEYTFRLKGMPWSFANDIPPIKPTDAAVKSRVRFVPMDHTFLTGEEYERRKDQPGVMLGDERIKAWVNSPDVGAAFAWMLTQAYVPHKVDVPPHVSVETKEWIQDGDQDEIITTVVKKAGPNDFITCAELESVTKEAGMEISKVKLGRLMHKTFGVKSAPKRVNGDLKACYNGVVKISTTES